MIPSIPLIYHKNRKNFIWAFNQAQLKYCNGIENLIIRLIIVDEKSKPNIKIKIYLI